jgi:hypothetical protein
VKIDDSTLDFSPHLLIHLHFMHLKRLEMHSPSSNHLVRIHKTNHINSRNGKKWGATTISQSIACLPLSQNLNNKGKTNNEKNKKMNNFGS